MLLNLLRGGSFDSGEVIAYILSALAVIFLTLPIHEFAHGFVAQKLGDDTPRWQGRITLNPFAHIDWIGAACILLMGFGWAKPVQVNARNFRNPKRDMAIVALAGPLSNIVVALICMLVCHALLLVTVSTVTALNILSYVWTFFFQIVSINIYLAVFNLLPVPPLDGSRLLAAFLPYKYYRLVMQYEQYIYYGLLLLLFAGVLDVPLDFLSNKLLSGIWNLAALPFKLFN